MPSAVDVRFQQQHSQYCIGLLHGTSAPFTVRLFTMLLRLLICLHPPSPLRLARRLRSIMHMLLLVRVY